MRQTRASRPPDGLKPAILPAPIALNRLELTNRLVMATTGDLGMSDALGRPTAKMIAYFETGPRVGTG